MYTKAMIDFYQKSEKESNMEKTAVEKFIEQLEEKGGAWENVSMGTIQISISTDEYHKLKMEAKEMEAEKDAKYNEMLEMLKCLIRVAHIEPDLYHDVRALIKKSTNL